MSIQTLHPFYFIAYVTFATFDVSAVSQHPKLLVVSYDGFRWDYFNRNITPFMNQLRDNGVHTDYMKSAFVTKTFPNHHAMATGLFLETHGVVGNEMINLTTKEVEKGSYELYHYNDEIAPFWILNEKASEDRHSGVMMWPGGRHEYLGILPTLNAPYNRSWPVEKRVDKLISWFENATHPINLGVLYIEDPDWHGHRLGVNSPEFNEIIKKLDNLTKYIYDKLQKEGLKDVNVIHLSDHGMQSITKETIIDLNNFVNQSDYSIVESSAALQIFPKKGKFDFVYRKLAEGSKTYGHFTVYKKEKIPDKYHYGKNPRIAPILIVADIGYAFNDIYRNIEHYEKEMNFTVTNKSEFGVHGYDNEEPDMRAIFFAYGPMFKEQYKLDPFNNTDLFPLFCKILDLSCPAVNGTLQNVDSCLLTTSDVSTLELLLATAGAVILLGSGIAVVVFIAKRRRDRSNAHCSTHVHDGNNVGAPMLQPKFDREFFRNENTGSMA